MADWKEEYKRRYSLLKHAGKPFFPYAVFKDTIFIALIFCLLGFLAYYYGAGLEDLADPSDASYNPRPEWYFLFLFQVLKFFPGHLESVAAVILPGLGIVALALLPLWDIGPARHPLDRPRLTGLGVVTLVVIGWLTWAGYKSPMINPIEERDPHVAMGQRLYRDMRCSYCHEIRGKGGDIGPQLDRVAGRKSEEWLERHFRDPQAVSPGSTMPKFNLLDDEIHTLIAYMKSFEGGAEPYTEEAPKLFVEHCASCHRIGKEGGDTAPDLSLIGSARDKSYIKGYILDPIKMNPSAAMPGFKGEMTGVQIEDLSRYLSSLGR